MHSFRTATIRRLACSAVLLLGIGIPVSADDQLGRQTWTIDGAEREALIYAPAKAKTASTPVVFAFHGHGGTMRHAAEKFAYQRHWPEAIAVYMQGLNTPGAITDPEGKRSGWQRTAGDQGDRDLKVFDAVLETLKKDFQVDEKRIYAAGHSNGGAFTYLLWAQRGDVFAAVAPSGAVARRPFLTLKPKPVLHVAGENDPLVRYEWQRWMIDSLRKLNRCGEGEPWGEHCTLYPSKAGTPLVTYITPGGHEFPEEAPPAIVKFFKQHSKP